MADKAAVKAPYFETSVTADVDVQISARELEEAGWVYAGDDKDAPAKLSFVRKLGLGAVVPLPEALASLHRQAHPSQPAEVLACREEPCRSLTFDQARPDGRNRS